MLPAADSYADLCATFRWQIPRRYNMAVDMTRHPEGAPALIFVEEHGAVRQFCFGEIRRLAGRYANALVAADLARGDRAAVMLGQCPEAAVAHLGALAAGLISVPLSTLFGEDALHYRLAHSGAKAIVTDAAGAQKLLALRDRLPALRRIFVVGADRVDGAHSSFSAALDSARDDFTAVDTAADDPALIVYTSGTTGSPKGALLPHRSLLGHQPGLELALGSFPVAGDRIWSPADWAWIGGLYDVLFTAWHHGVAVVAHRARKFDPDAAMDLMARFEVRNAFLPPTALKLLRQSNARHPGVKLRSVFSGGETLGTELLDWGRQALGVELREAYGQTECNVCISNSTLFPVRTGSMGRAAPGFDVRIVDDAGREVPGGEPGHVAVRKPNPVMFLEYWDDPDGTRAKFAGDFLITGDTGRQDEDGYFFYIGRSDDVIKSGGYRIGPGEVENCLMKHPAVAMAAVVGVPDPMRYQAVKAWIVLRESYAASDALASELQEFVRVRLSAHEYPRHVAFTDALPMTVTGKILRRELRARG